MVKITHKSSLVFIYLFVHTDGIPPVPEADGVDDRELGKNAWSIWGNFGYYMNTKYF